MPLVALEKAREGMKVIKDITNAEGLLLVPAGSVLREKHLDLLNSWSIPEIEVQDAPEEPREQNVLETLSPEELAQLKAKVQARFHQFDPASPVVQEAFRLALLREAARARAQ